MTYLRKPEWLKTQLKSDLKFEMVSRIVKEHNLHTICSSGRCPNMCECWNKGTATFMILGDICTRGCRFCNTATGRPLPPDPAEPAQLAESIRLMGLRHAVITAVTRDDLPDQGAAHWAASIRAVKQANPHTTLEVLIPDFDARPEWLDLVMAEYPEIISHNLETVRRLTPQVRTKARYDTSLDVLRYLSAHGVTTKTGIMLGLGETEDDAIGEAFDKVARALGLPYPGGVWIDRTCQKEGIESFPLPKAKVDGYNVSYSGLKSHLIRMIEKEKKEHGGTLAQHRIESYALSTEMAFIDQLLDKVELLKNDKPVKMIVVGGGVSANSYLRKRIRERFPNGPKIVIPPLWCTTDNAAMIAKAAHHMIRIGLLSPLSFNTRPNRDIEEEGKKIAIQ